VNFTPIVMFSLPLADNAVDLVGYMAQDVPDEVTIRVVDTDRTPGHGSRDTVTIDQIFIRNIE
jgi:hypothetical protein